MAHVEEENVLSMNEFKAKILAYDGDDYTVELKEISNDNIHIVKIPNIHFPEETTLGSEFEMRIGVCVGDGKSQIKGELFPFIDWDIMIDKEPMIH